MTMTVKITDPTRIEPLVDKELDLDCWSDNELFQKLFGADMLEVACNLYPGEAITITCVERVDD